MGSIESCNWRASSSSRRGVRFRLSFSRARAKFGFGALVFKLFFGELFDLRKLGFQVKAGAGELACKEDRNGAGQKEDDQTSESLSKSLPQTIP